MLRQMPKWIVFILFLHWLPNLEDGFDQYNTAFTEQTQFANNNNVNPASEF